MPYSKGISPFNAPNYDVFCAARREDKRGVILGAQLDGGQTYVPWIGLTTVRELALAHADVVGLVEKEDLDEAFKVGVALQSRIKELEAENAELKAAQEHIAGLVQAGFVVKKVQGRPAKREDA